MKVAVFGGTTEGRVLSEQLRLRGLTVHVYVATDYGKEVLPKDTEHVHVGRLSEEDMRELLTNDAFDWCVDATHPYASEVTKYIAAACEKTGTKLLRIGRRKLGDFNAGIVSVSDAKEAAKYLAEKKGRILVTTGSKELSDFSAIPDYRERLVVRLLATEEAMHICDKMEIPGANRICMQGPFSETMNYTILRDYGIEWLVTKESGSAGGYEEKIRAAKRAGVGIVVIGRPSTGQGTEYTVAEAVRIITGNAMKEEPKEVYVIGVGVGSSDMMTLGALRVLVKCDLVVGAKRVLETLDEIPAVFVGEGIAATRYTEYRAAYIMEYLEAHPEYRRIAVLFSGDVGFFSGAKDMLTTLSATDYKTEVIPGIASPIYMTDKLQIPWQEVRMVSNHGRDADIVTLLRQNRYVFSLTDSTRTVASLCADLTAGGLGDAKVTVGERLSYPDERFTTGTAVEMTQSAFDKLSVVLFEYEPKRMDGVVTWE